MNEGPGLYILRYFTSHSDLKVRSDFKKEFQSWFGESDGVFYKEKMEGSLIMDSSKDISGGSIGKDHPYYKLSLEMKAYYGLGTKLKIKGIL